MLEAQELSVRYGPKTVVDRVSFAVRPGRVTVVLGPNGAGKSTVLAALSGAVSPSDGTVTLDGEPIQMLSAFDLAIRRAVLEQTPTRDVPFTASELIGLAIPRALTPAAAADITARALLMLGLVELGAVPITRLSGGESHRAHMARTLAQLWSIQALGRDGYLLIDEPTASLDLSHQRDALDAARTAAGQGAGVIAVLHDLNQALAIADDVVLMQAGRIAASGPVTDVLTDAILSDVYNVPITTAEIDGRRIIVPSYNLNSNPIKEGSHVRRHEPV